MCKNAIRMPPCSALSANRLKTTKPSHIRWCAQVAGMLLAGALVGRAASAADTQAEPSVRELLAKARSVRNYHKQTDSVSLTSGTRTHSQSEIWVQGGRMRYKQTVAGSDGHSMESITFWGDRTAYTYLASVQMVQKIDLIRLKNELGKQANPLLLQPDTGVNPLMMVDLESLVLNGTTNIQGVALYVLEGQTSTNLRQSLMAGAPGSKAFAEAYEKTAGKTLGTNELAVLLAEHMRNIPVHATLWLETDDHLPHSIRLPNAAGRELLTQNYSEMVIDPQLDADFFDFIPPAGARIVDMTDAMIKIGRQTTAAK